MHGLRLDLLKSGAGVVSRRRWRGERPARRFVADGYAPTPVLLGLGIVFLIASAVAWTAAIWLVGLGAVLRFVVGVAAVPLSVLAVVFLSSSWASAFPGHIVFLEAGNVEEFRAAAGTELAALGAEPVGDDVEQAERRLWDLANRLSSGGPSR